MITKEEISKIVRCNFDKYDYIFYKHSKEYMINLRIETTFAILNSELKFLEVIEQVRKKNILNIIMNRLEMDIYQTSYKDCCLYYNIPLENIKKRYSDKYEEVEERMMFRIELYKEGWSVEQIEKYIHKYLIKNDVYNKRNGLRNNQIFYNYMLRRGFYKKEREIRLGRPSLPKGLKEYIKNKHSCKLRENMRKKYDASTAYEKIKEYLFSKEEVDEIVSKIDNKSIIEKVKKLELFDITKK